MCAECVSAFMSFLGAQLCPQPSIPSIPNQNESSHCLCDAFELASRKLWECKMCLWIMLCRLTLKQTHAYLFVGLSLRGN